MTPDDPPSRGAPAPVVVTCPRCGAAYRLPAARLGAHGARVRCPACGARFVVDAGGNVSAPPAAGTAAVPPEQLAALADRVIAELLHRCGPRLLRASAEGRLFSAFGGEVMAAWEDYRAAAGQAAPAAPFRAALRARLGVDLEPGG